MMKRILIRLLLAVVCVYLAWADGELGVALDALIYLKVQRVLVVLHRGDWRNAP